MIRPYALAANPFALREPGQKLPVGPTDLRDPGGERFVAEWLAHVYRNTAALREAGLVNEEARAIVLANERLMFGRQRTILD